MSSGEWRGYDGCHVESVSAEERLWMAVIEKSVQDFRLKLYHAEKDLKRIGRLSAGTLWDLKQLRYEMKTDWYWEIAQYAGMDSSRIVRFLDKEALKIGVDLSRPALNPDPRVRGSIVL